jgi:hypothetical protein
VARPSLQHRKFGRKPSNHNFSYSPPFIATLVYSYLLMHQHHHDLSYVVSTLIPNAILGQLLTRSLFDQASESI